MELLIRKLLVQLGEDPRREGLRDTPRRVAQSFAFLTEGYSQSVEQIVEGAVFSEKYDEMVIVKDIDFYSLCEHHLLPFFGHVHVAYLPDGRLIGLSKIPRIVEVFSRRLQLQERMTVQIAECLQDILQPKGVAVVVDAQHLCISMRGIEKQHARTVTSEMLGAFRNQTRTRAEFLSLIGLSAARTAGG
ncbi:MAG: GTP cyclohydrolase I FolE [Candidatus Sumerlaeia bacterium]|nr:GTP cyclohydrolase I FolE [Candidatus Sumerlaeia bacterium]